MDKYGCLCFYTQTMNIYVVSQRWMLIEAELDCDSHALQSVNEKLNL